MKKQLLILTTLFTVVIGYSQTFTENFITYSVTSTANNTVKTIEYTPTGVSTVVIPATVTDTNTNITYNVTEIGAASFRDNSLTAVTIPEGITVIGSNSFRDNSIANIEIPDSVVTIGGWAFINNQSTNLELGLNLTNIGDRAFFLNNLSTLIIPDSVTTIGNTAFAQNNITSISFGNGLLSIDDFTFRFNNLTNLTIPDNITSIGSLAFSDNPLTCVISESTTPATITTGGNNDSFGLNRSNIDLSIPVGTTSAYTTAQWTGFNSVNEGMTNTFVVNNITYEINPSSSNEVTITDYNTAGGTMVTIPATVTNACNTYNVTDIGVNAFLSKNITSVTISDSVINIGQGAFNNNSINSLILGNNVEIIGNWAFQNNNLENVSIPNSVTSINFRAFNNNNIINLSLGNSVETIGANAFANCAIANISIPDSVLSIGDFAFTNNSALSNLIIGNSVVSIGKDAFISLIAPITSITIPNSVTTIGDSAFYLTSLTDVFSEGTTPPTITTGTNDTFGDATNRSTIHLHIPVGTMDAYITNPSANADWTGFNPVTENAVLSTSNFEIADTISIYPNPVVSKIYINSKALIESVTILDISGKTIKQNFTVKNEIDVSNLSKGVYFLQIVTLKGIVSKKFVKN